MKKRTTVTAFKKTWKYWFETRMTPSKDLLEQMVSYINHSYQEAYVMSMAIHCIRKEVCTSEDDRARCIAMWLMGYKEGMHDSKYEGGVPELWLPCA